MRQTTPRNLENVDNGVRCISIDGDADRIVYFFKDKDSSKFVLLDGDKIATLGTLHNFFIKVFILVVQYDLLNNFLSQWPGF